MASPPVTERGAALLTVLVLVAVMAALSAAAVDRLMLATRLAANADAGDQARAYLVAAESQALLRIGDLAASRTVPPGAPAALFAQPLTMAVPGGSATVRLADGGKCFNLNSLAGGSDAPGRAAQTLAMAQFATLMGGIGIDANRARVVAASAADWVDADASPLPGGAEDEVYGQLRPPYRTPNRLMADASELRAISGVDAASYRLVRPWVCALPTAEPAALNVNALTPGDAPLLAMLFTGRLPAPRARQYLLQRPPGGFANVASFWAVPLQDGFAPDSRAMQQVAVRTRFYRLAISAMVGAARADETVLVDGGTAPARLVVRQRQISGDE